MPVTDTGAREHMAMLLNSIQRGVAETMPALAERLVNVASERAPSVDEEYNELNAPAGETPLVGRAGNTSADTDGRIRFEKPESTYLRNAILAPDDQQTELRGLLFFARVGNRQFLGNMASFRFVNKANNETAEHEVTDYFNMFEGGTAGGITTLVIEPHEPGYDLRPGEDADGKRKSVTKRIVGRAMFSPAVLSIAARAAITRALAEIGPGRDTS